MSEWYTTVISYFSQLEFWEVCVLVSFAALPIIIKILKKNKVRTVPKYYYYSLVAITVIMASGLALQNALYGYEQGTNLFRAAVTGTLFFVGDALLIALCYRFFPYWIAVIFGSLSIIGFAFMSMFAAFAFLVGQQHLKDNYQTTSKQAQIMRLDNHLAILPPGDRYNRRDTLREISKLGNQIDTLSNNQGGYVSSGSAAYQLIAKNTGYTFEQVSMVLRMFWSLAFVIGSMAGGGILAHLRIEGGGVKTGTATATVRRSTQKSKAHANDSNFEPNVQKMISFLSKKTDGYEVTEKVIRGQTKATDKQIRLIRKQLKTLGWLKAGVNGGATTYVKSTPSLATVESIKKPFWKLG